MRNCELLYLQSEKAMATHSSTPAWKIPWMEEPGRLHSMGLLRVGHDRATLLSVPLILTLAMRLIFAIGILVYVVQTENLNKTRNLC